MFACDGKTGRKAPGTFSTAPRIRSWFVRVCAFTAGNHVALVESAAIAAAWARTLTPEVVRVVAVDLLDEIRQAGDAPEAEAGEPAVLRHRPDGEGLLGRELGGEGRSVGEVAVRDVVEQQQMVVVRDLGDRADLLPRVPRTERVQRIDQEDHPGLRRDRLADPVGGEPVGRLVDVEVPGLGRGELDELVDDEVARVGGDRPRRRRRAGPG